MPTAIEGNAPWSVTRGTTPVAANDVERIGPIPDWAHVVTICFPTSDGKVASSGTDGAAIGSHYDDYPAGMKLPFDADLTGQYIYLASATSAATFVIHCEAKRR